MAQSQIQRQAQEQKQEQRLAARVQQLLQAHLIELPLNQFVERVDTEMNDNPALEANADGENVDDTAEAYTDGDDMTPTDDYDAATEMEERRSALDEALENMGRDDEDLPVYQGGALAASDEKDYMFYGNDVSFYDRLREQMREINMTEKQRAIMEYLIGSLDDDGLLRKTADAIADELAIYHNIDATDGEIEEVIRLLQDFEPAGIGARDLRECLLIQIDRRDPSTLKTLMHRVITKYFEAFTRKHWDKIRTSLSLSEMQADALMGELRKLNPKPGASLGESIGHSIQQITPDFIVDTLDDGTVTFVVNNGEVPELQVSKSFADTIRQYRQSPDTMSRQTKEALLYTRKKVAAAQSFIEAMKVRQRTLTLTMHAIIQWQHRFFEDGDEASLRPMNLKDIAEKTGFNISTVSRVSNSKYALTRWGVFPLRHFFSDGYMTESGEELSTRAIKVALREIVDGEDKKRPLNDDRLSELLAERGFPIARRTVAKYREQMGIPVARMRK